MEKLSVLLFVFYHIWKCRFVFQDWLYLGKSMLGKNWSCSVAPSVAEGSLLQRKSASGTLLFYETPYLYTSQDNRFPIFNFFPVLHYTANNKDPSTSVGMTIRECRYLPMHILNMLRKWISFSLTDIALLSYCAELNAFLLENRAQKVKDEPKKLGEAATTLSHF